MALKAQEAGTLLSLGAQNKGGMVVVSDRAKRATLARLLGLEELVVVMPQEHLAKIVMQDTHREDHRRTPQEVIARARKHVWIPKGTQRARKLLRGEADPEDQLQGTPGQEGFSPRRGGERLRGEGSPGSQLQGGTSEEVMPKEAGHGSQFREEPGPEDGSYRSGGERQRGQEGQ